MKRIIRSFIILSLAATLLAGCAANPFFGLAYTRVKAPTIALSQKIDASTFEKKGEASCINYFGLVATGNASLEAAMKNGGITRVHHVDCKYKFIMGVYSKFTLVVYGE
jgi:hypothetical protein